jgi:hypothetical protein
MYASKPSTPLEYKRRISNNGTTYEQTDTKYPTLETNTKRLENIHP